MPVIFKITFPAGRYHATPWGRHVNEGVAEWPPSPWRLLRALVAVWKRTLPELSEDQVRQALEPLATPPAFHLPPHRVAHTRHYMPWEKKGPDDRTLVFDTFVSVARGHDDPTSTRDHASFIGWPDASLDGTQSDVLAKLVGQLTSLGRAESWVETELIADPASHWDTINWNCQPDKSSPDPVAVFCPDPATCFADTHYPTLDAKKLAKGKVNPKDYLFDCPRWHLCLDTESIHAKRWPTVPGSQCVNYQRPTEAPHRPPRVVSMPNRPTVAHFLLDGPVLPLVTDTLVVGEAFRSAAMSRFDWHCKRDPERFAMYQRRDDPGRFSSRILSGKELDGARLSGPGHAHYLPLPLESDPRRIGSVLVVARDRFNQDEVAAISGISWLNVPTLKRDEQSHATATDDESSTHNSKRRGRRPNDLSVALVGLGNADSVFPPGAGLTGSSDEWISMTPFLGHESIGSTGRSRHLRKGIRREWRRFVEECSTVDPELQDIKLLDIEELDSDTVQRLGRPQPFKFRRNRRKDSGRTAWRACAMYRLRFSLPFTGPLMLGYGCHFGMGLFVIPTDLNRPTS